LTTFVFLQIKVIVFGKSVTSLILRKEGRLHERLARLECGIVGVKFTLGFDNQALDDLLTRLVPLDDQEVRRILSDGLLDAADLAITADAELGKRRIAVIVNLKML
jgi:hypothetical protein